MFKNIFAGFVFFSVLNCGTGSTLGSCSNQVSPDSPKKSLIFEYKNTRTAFDHSSFRAAKLKLYRVSVVNPAYGGIRKTYLGYLLTDILGLVDVTVKSGQRVTFRCRDGSEPTLDLASALRESVGFIAVGETDSSGLLLPFSKVKVGDGKFLDPSPYYLVWTGGRNYPLGWPFQLHTARIVDEGEK